MARVVFYSRPPSNALRSKRHARRVRKLAGGHTEPFATSLPRGVGVRCMVQPRAGMAGVRAGPKLEARCRPRYYGFLKRGCRGLGTEEPGGNS